MLAGDGQSYITYPGLEAFSGRASILERNGHHVVVGTHNRHPVLGEVALLHSHRVVYPLNFGGADATDDWSLGDWCDQCHRKGGLVVWTNAVTRPSGTRPKPLPTRSWDTSMRSNSRQVAPELCRSGINC